MRPILMLLFTPFICLTGKAQTTISDMLERGIQELRNHYSKSEHTSKYTSRTHIYSNVFPYEFYKSKISRHKKEFAHYTYYSELTLKHRKSYILEPRFMFPAKDTVCVRFMNGTFDKPANWILDGTGYYTYYVYNDSCRTWKFERFIGSNHAYFKDLRWQPRSLVVESVKAFLNDYPSYEKCINKKRDEDYYYYQPLYMGDFTCESDLDSIATFMRTISIGTWIRRIKERHVTIVGLPNIILLNDGTIKVELYFQSFKSLRYFKHKHLYTYCHSSFFTFPKGCQAWVLTRSEISTLKQ